MLSRRPVYYYEKGSIPRFGTAFPEIYWACVWGGYNNVLLSIEALTGAHVDVGTYNLTCHFDILLLPIIVWRGLRYVARGGGTARRNLSGRPNVEF